jgi:hypothetical protein
MKISTILPLVFLVIAAVPSPAPAQGQAQTPEAPSLVLIDLRPPEERDTSALTELEGKCNKNVFRIPDVASDPLKPDVLKADLTEMLGQTGELKTLAVLNWSIYYNKQVQKSGGLFDSVGVQGYSLPGKKKGRKGGSVCARNESAGGWYEADELESVFYPLVSEFQGTYGGKPVNVRVVYSPRAKIAGEFQGAEDDTRELLDAVHATSVAVAEAALK